ncbi:MAG TPA: molybdenum cofactor guanylyltransferase [Bryobacteraceae bacterium]|nr:molybdenum cofactor guanylyltransferase [Bryobacteraceae bacterium]
MRRPAGFVLVGGRSRRMGTDKALLRHRGGRTLVECIAERLASVCEGVALIGPAERYRHLHLPVLADAIAERGPAGGVLAALRHGAEWNLIVACDMPGVCEDLFLRLIGRARAADVDCVVPITAEGQEHPLCALYSERCRDGWEQAMAEGLNKIGQIVRRFRTARVPVEDERHLQNLNTLADWHSYLRSAGK